MRGINKHLVVPTVLASVILLSSAVLTTSASVDENIVAITGDILPATREREIFKAELTEVPTTENATTHTALIPTTSTPTATQTSSPPPTPIPTPTPTTSTPNVLTEVATQTPATIQATLIVQGPGISLSHQIELEAGETVYVLLKKASKKFDFSVKVSQHQSLGVLIEGIAGTANNPKINRYWLYYVNGQFASRGVSTQVVKEGDIIKWSYE